MAAPAIQIGMIEAVQWNKAFGWVIGAEAYPSWAHAYPDLDLSSGASAAANRLQPKLSTKCTTGQGLMGVEQVLLGNHYFSQDVNSIPVVKQVMPDQTPGTPDRDLPVLLAQGTKDTIIPPATNKSSVAEWCADGVAVDHIWPSGVEVLGERSEVVDGDADLTGDLDA